MLSLQNGVAALSNGYDTLLSLFLASTKSCTAISRCFLASSATSASSTRTLWVVGAAQELTNKGINTTVE
jgi:hypothetical protein